MYSVCRVDDNNNNNNDDGGDDSLSRLTRTYSLQSNQITRIDSIIVHVCHPSCTTQETLGHATHFFSLVLDDDDDDDRCSIGKRKKPIYS